MVVIADDITGAAEIAGIGLRFGLRVNLMMYHGEEYIAFPEGCDLMVYATDTRSLPVEEAVAETARLARALKAGMNGHYELFKKTDSALRGHIVSELQALMDTLGIKSALLLPQNPSKQRIIRNGMYYINDVPLHKTSFSYDPEFPASTANVIDYFGNRVALLPPRETGKEAGIYIANASTSEEVVCYASSLNSQTLPAGGADFFTHYLIAKGHSTKEIAPFSGLGNNESIVVCGSTAKHLLSSFDYIRRKNISACNMPERVFLGSDSTEWINELKAVYQQHPSLILQINHPPQEGREVAVRLRQVMGKAVLSLLSERYPQELIIEGGATAYSILELLGWKSFTVKQEVSPGVIQIVPTNHTNITVTLKPGSYSWGELFR